MEGLLVNRPEQWICWQKPRDISLNASKGHQRRLCIDESLRRPILAVNFISPMPVESPKAK
jgi:hypothetical protein